MVSILLLIWCDKIVLSCILPRKKSFVLAGLSKSDKISEVGGRNFYLRTSSRSSSFHFAGEGSDLTSQSSSIELATGSSSVVVPSHSFVSFVVKKMQKIGRRTRKLWNLVAGIACLWSAMIWITAIYLMLLVYIHIYISREQPFAYLIMVVSWYQIYLIWSKEDIKDHCIGHFYSFIW